VQLQDYQTQVQQLIHDSSALDFSLPELTAFINNARTRVALDFACVRTYFTNLSVIINQETYPINGGVGGAIITNGGVYSSPPTVTFGAPPAGGVTATGVALMGGTGSSQFVQQIGMTNWGSGYTSTPTVTFGSGAAAATAQALVDVIDFHAVAVLFGTQRFTLQWWPFVRFNAFLRSNTLSAGQPGVWSNYTEQNKIYIYPALPDQNYPLEVDAYVLPNPLVNTSDADVQINAPMSDCVQFYASHLALLKGQNFDQADYYRKRYEGRRAEIANTRLPVRRSNIYQSSWRRVQRGW